MRRKADAGPVRRILIGIGANLPGSNGRAPLETCRQSVAALDALPGLRLRGLSRWYVTAPVPVADQPDYVNAVAHLTGEADPAHLLAALQAIEARAGRRRGARNAARPIDLDIIDMDGMVRAGPDPVLPHPRAHERAFVLLPLRDVAPDWVHPVLAQGLVALIATLPAQRIRVL